MLKTFKKAQFNTDFRFIFRDNKFEEIYVLIKKLHYKIIEKLFFELNNNIVNIQNIKDFN